MKASTDRRLATLEQLYGNPGDALSLEAIVATARDLKRWLLGQGYASAMQAEAAGIVAPEGFPITIFDLAEAERRVEAHRLSCADRR
jgi:hypothetical protein